MIFRNPFYPRRRRMKRWIFMFVIIYGVVYIIANRYITSLYKPELFRKDSESSTHYVLMLFIVTNILTIVGTFIPIVLVIRRLLTSEGTSKDLSNTLLWRFVFYFIFYGIFVLNTYLILLDYSELVDITNYP